MRTPIKTKCGDKQWKPRHLLLARAFIFHIIKCFHQWSSAHSFNPVNHNPDHIALEEEEEKKKDPCIACTIERRRERNVSLSSFPFDAWKQIWGPLQSPTMDTLPQSAKQLELLKKSARNSVT